MSRIGCKTNKHFGAATSRPRTWFWTRSSWGNVRRWRFRRRPRRGAVPPVLHNKNIAPPRSRPHHKTTTAIPAGGCTLASSSSSGARTLPTHILPTSFILRTLTHDPTAPRLVPAAVPQRAASSTNTFTTRCSLHVASRTPRTNSAG